jgi:hypothetical protein
MSMKKSRTPKRQRKAAQQAFQRKRPALESKPPREKRSRKQKSFATELLQGEHLWLGFDQHPDIRPPKIPEEFDPGETAFFPRDVAMRFAPEGAQFVVAVASSFSMHSETRNGFFIAPTSISIWKWVLWCLDLDQTDETWIWRVRASTDRSFGSRAEAAAYLLFQAWKEDKTKWDRGMFDEVEDCGELLSENEIMDIAEKAFGEKWTD